MQDVILKDELPEDDYFMRVMEQMKKTSEAGTPKTNEDLPNYSQNEIADFMNSQLLESVTLDVEDFQGETKEKYFRHEQLSTSYFSTETRKRFRSDSGPSEVSRTTYSPTSTVKQTNHPTPESVTFTNIGTATTPGIGEEIANKHCSKELSDKPLRDRKLPASFFTPGSRKRVQSFNTVADCQFRIERANSTDSTLLFSKMKDEEPRESFLLAHDVNAVYESMMSRRKICASEMPITPSHVQGQHIQPLYMHHTHPYPQIRHTHSHTCSHNHGYYAPNISMLYSNAQKKSAIPMCVNGTDAGVGGRGVISTNVVSGSDFGKIPGLCHHHHHGGYLNMNNLNAFSSADGISLFENYSTGFDISGAQMEADMQLRPDELDALILSNMTYLKGLEAPVMGFETL